MPRCNLKAMHITGMCGGRLPLKCAPTARTHSLKDFKMWPRNIFCQNHQITTKGRCGGVHFWMGGLSNTSTSVNGWSTTLDICTWDWTIHQIWLELHNISNLDKAKCKAKSFEEKFKKSWQKSSTRVIYNKKRHIADIAETTDHHDISITIPNHRDIKLKKNQTHASVITTMTNKRRKTLVDNVAKNGS